MPKVSLTGYGTWDELATASGADANVTVFVANDWVWAIADSQPTKPYSEGTRVFGGVREPMRLKNGETLWGMPGPSSGAAPFADVTESAV